MRVPTDKDPCQEAVRVITGSLILGNVGDAQNVQLLLSASASGIDREQDGPGDTAADEQDHGGQLEEAQQQIGIHRVVLQHVSVGDLVHGGDPVKKASRGFGRALPGTQSADVGSRHVRAALAAAQEHKQQDHDQEDEAIDHERAQERRGGAGLLRGTARARAPSEELVEATSVVRHGYG